MTDDPSAGAPSKFFLADKVKVGDYVLYDAGEWTEEIKVWGGNCVTNACEANTSRNLTTTGMLNTKYYPGGWKVIGVDGKGSEGVVTIALMGGNAWFWPDVLAKYENGDLVDYLEDFVNRWYVDREFATVGRLPTIEKTGYDNDGDRQYYPYWSDCPGEIICCIKESGKQAKAGSMHTYNNYSQESWGNKALLSPVIELRKGILTDSYMCGYDSINICWNLYRY